MNLESVILFQIDKTSKISKLYSQREFDRLGLSITVEQWILLKTIHENQGLTQNDLAIKSLRDPASITRTLDLLSKKDLIERKSVPGNRRQYHIFLSKHGDNFIRQHLPVINAHRAKSVEGFSPEELESLGQMLIRIQKNMG